MITDYQCIICGNKDFAIPYQRDFEVAVCADCKFGIVHPIPTSRELEQLYNSQQYFSTHMHVNPEKLSAKDLKSLIQKQGIFHYKYLKPYLNKNSTLLEIGPGYGLHLKYLSDSGYQVKGLEPSETAFEYASNILQLNIMHSGFEAYHATEQFDIIMLNHVLEHFTDLHKVMEKIKLLLKPNGYLYIRVPNHDSYDRRKMRENWPAYLPFHISYFSEKSLRLLFSKYQLHLILVDEYVSDSVAKHFQPSIKGFIRKLIYQLKLTKRYNGRTITLIAQNHA